MSDWNDSIIQEFRANAGTVERFGRSLVILHTVGAKSGEARLNPVMGLPDGDGWLVTASAAGSPVDPAWAHNLRAHPAIELEVPADNGIETVSIHAQELPEPERIVAWKKFTDASDGFKSYEQKTDRKIPVFRLERA